MTNKTGEPPPSGDQATETKDAPIALGAIFRRLGPVGPIAILSSTVPALAL